MFIKAGLFDEGLVAAQEYDLWLRMLKIIPYAKTQIHNDKKAA